MMAVRNTARGPNADTDESWWAPRRYGYGAGLPIAWQGWAITLAYCIAVTLAAWLILPRSIFAFVTIVLGATAALILVCAMKTRGGWRWRWGGDA
jgi:hypothetical protein